MSAPHLTASDFQQAFAPIEAWINQDFVETRLEYAGEFRTGFQPQILEVVAVDGELADGHGVAAAPHLEHLPRLRRQLGASPSVEPPGPRSGVMKAQGVAPALGTYAAKPAARGNEVPGSGER